MGDVFLEDTNAADRRGRCGWLDRPSAIAEAGIDFRCWNLECMVSDSATYVSDNKGNGKDLLRWPLNGTTSVWWTVK